MIYGTRIALLTSSLLACTLRAEESSLLDRVKIACIEQMAKSCLKVQDLKYRGPSRSDIIKTSVVCVGLYAVYVYYTDKKKRALLSKLAGAAGLVAGCYFLWNSTRKPQESPNERFVNRFLGTLTDKQRTMIAASQKLGEVIQDAQHDPLYLITPELMDLLDEEQQLKLEKALDEYMFTEDSI